ncbi:Tripeptidyl-peptidase 1 [Collichthys lucidus]|uniref:Tripeptidyl-peptidase 1 n=1 Tax=Collichthys lucidus TaxID=240159 RepID=A0A4U5VHU3_COLLU|nr:Tripeptidyl-peptidase 1 [Collichthys lucidus]
MSTLIPDDWTHVGRVDPSEELELTFALKQQHVDLLEETLRLVSDPDSAQYGKHLTLEEISSLLRPSELTQKVVRQWLQSHGITNCLTVHTQDFLQCTMTAEVAETLLPGSKFQRYTRDRQSVVRSSAPYSVHDAVHQHLDFVGGLHRFPPKVQQQTKASSDRKQKQSKAGVHLGVTPAILRARYNLTAADVGRARNNSQAVAQFLEQYFSPADLAEFMTLFGRSFPHRSQVDRVVGTQGAGKAGVEASLDIEYIMSTGANISTWLFTNPVDGFAQQHDGPAVGSHHQLRRRRRQPVYRVHDAHQHRVHEGRRQGDLFAVCFCPYVTTVGGTSFKNPFKVTYEVSDYISGGGFSNVFKMPDYQVSAVNAYLKTVAATLPPQSYYNTSGRAYPDMAALSHNYWVVVNRIPTPWVSGTSASTPVVGGMLSLINDQRLLKGLPALGFLNPRLYKLKGQALFDVTEGCHLACLDEQVQGEGFCASPSWDPVTGWGTPNYPALLAVLLAE